MWALAKEKEGGYFSFMWVWQRVSYRVYWHSVHLHQRKSISLSRFLFFFNGGGHPANKALLASLCKTHVMFSLWGLSISSVLLSSIMQVMKRFDCLLLQSACD